MQNDVYDAGNEVIEETFVRVAGLNLPVPTRPLKDSGLCPEAKPTWAEWMRETGDRTRALLRISQKPVRRKAGKPFVL